MYQCWERSRPGPPQGPYDQNPDNQGFVVKFCFKTKNLGKVVLVNRKKQAGNLLLLIQLTNILFAICALYVTSCENQHAVSYCLFCLTYITTDAVVSRGGGHFKYHTSNPKSWCYYGRACIWMVLKLLSYFNKISPLPAEKSKHWEVLQMASSGGLFSCDDVMCLL